MTAGASPDAGTILPPRREMLRAIASRDSEYDGVFYTCVKTTGVFCKPSCRSKPPKPENVEFVGSPREALLAGFRPCKRCRPMDAAGATPAWVRRVLDEVEKRPTERIADGELRAMGIDPARVRRHFLRHYGMTFHAYHRARRMGMALGMLHGGADALRVAFDSGYESSSGFRDAFTRTFGAPPGRGRDATCIVSTIAPSPIGPLLLGATDDGVCLLEFADRRALKRQLETLRRRFDAAIVPGRHALLTRLTRELDAYFDGRLTRFTVPLSTRGTPFQERVWKAVGEIPYGETRSYEQIARAIGAPLSARPVGRANGDNRMALLIPCHRVVGASGQLTGYGGGLWRKKFLLDLELRSVGAANATDRRIG